MTSIYSTRDLRARGLRRTDIRRALDDGTLRRARRGWYALPTTPAATFTAARAGGALTCVSALRQAGAWVLDVPEVHVRVSSGIEVRRAGRLRLHWTASRVTPGCDDVARALDVAAGCLDLRALVVVVDSVVNRRILSGSEVRRILGSSARGRRALAHHDPRAESGIETLVRLALRRLRLRPQSQAVIARVGRVDFLIGERLVIEADGYEWHGDPVAFERDRARDRELVRRGYVVIRISYRQVLDELPDVLLAVSDIVRRRDHRWRAVHRTQLSRSGYLVELSSPSERDREG